MSESLNLKGYIVTVDIEKALDSLSHSFLLVCLKKYGYGYDFIKWVEMLLECQESSIINGGNTTNYFKLQKGARQGDPISPYLFILCLEIVFILIKASKRVKGINIFERTYLYSACADDTTFFLRDKRSIKELINTFATFSKYSGLKPNHEKCEIAGNGVLKSVKVAVCGMKCIDMCNDTKKITGIHFSYNKKKRNEKNFLDSITKIQNVLKVWRMRRLTLEGKIMVFKTLAISKIVFLSLISKVSTEIISQLEKILWPYKPKIKNETLCSDFKHGGLKNVNIQKKIISLQCSWVRRLYDDSFHEWKVIPLKLIKKSFRSHFKFHSNLLFNISRINDFPSFYLGIFCNWKKYFSTNPETPSCILSQYLWFNKFIIVDNSYVNFTNFSTKSINFVSDLVNENCNFKSWETLKNEYHLDNKLYFQWMQLIQAIPLIWKQKINDSEKNVEKSYVVQDHHLIKNTRIISLDKLTTTEISLVLLLSSGNTPTSQKYFRRVFPNENFDWKKIYILPRLVTINSFQRNFQYKILHNILYVNNNTSVFILPFI